MGRNGQKACMDMSIELFCLPYAGGSSFVYESWKRILDGEISVIAMDYAGHGRRFMENAGESIGETAEDLYNKIMRRDISNKRICIYGHSMGGIVAYHIAVRLQEFYDVIPEALFIGACRPPATFCTSGERKRDDRELLSYLISENRISAGMAENKEFLNYVFPAVKKDFQNIAEYRPLPAIRLKSPVVGFYGSRDKGVAREEMAGWEAYTSSGIELVQMAGDHFFLETEQEALCREIRHRIKQAQ